MRCQVPRRVAGPGVVFSCVQRTFAMVCTARRSVASRYCFLCPADLCYALRCQAKPSNAAVSCVQRTSAMVCSARPCAASRRVFLCPADLCYGLPSCAPLGTATHRAIISCVQRTSALGCTAAPRVAEPRVASPLYHFLRINMPRRFSPAASFSSLASIKSASINIIS